MPHRTLLSLVLAVSAVLVMVAPAQALWSPSHHSIIRERGSFAYYTGALSSHQDRHLTTNNPDLESCQETKARNLVFVPVWIAMPSNLAYDDDHYWLEIGTGHWLCRAVGGNQIDKMFWYGYMKVPNSFSDFVFMQWIEGESYQRFQIAQDPNTRAWRWYIGTTLHYVYDAWPDKGLYADTGLESYDEQAVVPHFTLDDPQVNLVNRMTWQPWGPSAASPYVEAGMGGNLPRGSNILTAWENT